MIFIQENAAFNQVLTYQDWHNQLLNTINFILLLNFKESFFNYLKLGGKVADFSERSSRRFSSASVLIESTENESLYVEIDFLSACYDMDADYFRRRKNSCHSPC